MPADAPAGLTVTDVARRYRISPDKARAWIRRGELPAINTGTAGRPRFVVTPEALAAFEQSRRAAASPPRPPRRRRWPPGKDYFPDL
jgi:hypothetical protein